MSWRLRVLIWVLAVCVRPVLARTLSPQRARRDFGRASWIFRAPPFLLHLGTPGSPALQWISVGPGDLDWVILYFHGGAYFAGSADTYAALMGRISKLTGLQVVAPDYRLAPEHPAPAAFDDARAAHSQLLARGYRADRIILGGDSAGGGLALALLADLCARNLRPAGVFALSPWTDLALTGDSLTTNARADPLLPVARVTDAVGHVLGGLAATDPRISPLYGAFALPPPVLIQVGSTEILLDDSRRMADVLRQSGGQVLLQETPGAPHVWQIFDGYVPESRAALRKVADFILLLRVRPGN